MRSEIPKVLHRVCGRTLLERTMQAAVQTAPKEIVVVIGYGRQQVQDEIDRVASLPAFAGVEVRSVYQAEQLGTGHAAEVGLEGVSGSEKVLILPGDTPLIDGEILKTFISESPADAAVSLLSCVHPQPSGFGRIIRGGKGEVREIVEERDCSEEQRAISEINTSFYFCEREFLQSALGQLKTDNAQGECYLTDIVAAAVADGRQVHAVCTDRVHAVSGANTRAELSVLERQRRMEINKELMESGVTIEDPCSTFIDEGVQVGQDSILGPGTYLRGDTRIGEETVVEGMCRITDSTIGPRVLIRWGCYFNEAEVAAECQLGPFAQLRPQAVLREGVKIGNFVEIKKSELGKGAKANHLAYIGDARVGAGSNIGAGTIFCNYDGTTKSESILDEGVFVGSNSTLVSPIHIGRDAYVAAGSTVTKNVPSGALAIGRSRQSNKEGWVVRRKKKDT